MSLFSIDNYFIHITLDQFVSITQNANLSAEHGEMSWVVGGHHSRVSSTNRSSCKMNADYVVNICPTKTNTNDVPKLN